MSIKDKVAIIGVGCTKFGDNFEKSYHDMVIDAAYEAYQDAGIEPKDIEAAWLGTFDPDTAGYEGHAGFSLADPLRLYGLPVSRVANFCATGTDALRNACFAVAAGMYKIALVVGCEKMRDVPPRDSMIARSIEKGHPLLTKGRTAPGGFALLANRYLHKHDLDREILGRVAIKNHANGAKNSKAHFQKEIDLDTYYKAPMIADPFGLFDCCPTTDGAAAAIITTRELAKSFRDDYVLVKGIGLAVSHGWNIPFDRDFDFLGFQATQEAAKQAYKQVGISNPRKEISFAEVHDCFTFTEIINYEDLFFCERGEGWRFIKDGCSALDGELPVNPSGGLKSFGHPIGATGVRMVYEITKQLQGKCGPRQVKNPQLGLAHNVGGPGIVGLVAILGRN